MIKTEKSFEDMSLDELKKLKSDWYREAETNGSLSTVYKICRELGEKLAADYGPKYELKLDDTVVFVDDYGNYMTVLHEGRCVCSTHPGTKLFVPGEWYYQLKNLYASAEESIKSRKNKADYEERVKLGIQLGLISNNDVVAE